MGAGFADYDDIYIIDIIDKDTYKLGKSKVLLLTIKECELVPTRLLVLSGGKLSDDMNELLVNEILRECKCIISLYVIGIICMYLNDQSLHCIGYDYLELIKKKSILLFVCLIFWHERTVV